MRKTKILIADDNPDLRWGLELQLLVHGYEVVTVENADLAVAHAQKDVPDVLIVDIWMDSGNRVILSDTGNGFGVVERINKLPETSGIPVIYMTGANSLQLELRAKQLGAFGLIHKPINLPELVKMIERAILTRVPACGALAAAAVDEIQNSAAIESPEMTEG